MNPKDDALRKGRRGRTTKQGATPADARRAAKKLERSFKIPIPWGRKK